MNVQHSVRRKFTAGVGPNQLYRPWLEMNVGKQGVAWNWNICKDNMDMMRIEFASREHATLFKLTWPQ